MVDVERMGMSQPPRMRKQIVRFKSSPVVTYLKLIFCLSVFVFLLFITALIVYLLVR